MSSLVRSDMPSLADYGIDAEAYRKLRSSAERVASVVRLPLRHTNWSGTLGNWQGAGIGSSIDFQDHRQYMPGDDPRYINWQAFARTGSYSMKLYREEVSPKMDLVLDVSVSMFLDQDKARRTIELFHFLVASARAAGTLLRCYQCSTHAVEPISLDALDAGSWQLADGRDLEAVDVRAPASAPLFQNVPWRVNAMRVVLSDLLFPVDADGLLRGMQSGRGGLLLFSPWSYAEAEPDWSGNVELEDCERGAKRDLRFTAKDLEIYRQRYRQHFSLWQQLLVKRGGRFARIAASSDLQDEIMKEPLEAGLVELWN